LTTEYFQINMIRFGRHFLIQLNDIWFYWLIGIFFGSLVSVLGKDRIYRLSSVAQGSRPGVPSLLSASLIGLASPLCMYGTIPVAASFAHSGVREDWLAAFMMSSVLLNPQLLVYSAVLGPEALLLRMGACLVCGLAAGVFVRTFYKKSRFFDFSGFVEPVNRDIDKNPLFRLLKSIGRNTKATGLYFLLGVMLAALFQTFVPSGAWADYFGGRSGAGVLLAATLGVPVYVCGGGTIPLLHSWMQNGMGLGAATAFMITGPATKVTNLGAVKIVLGFRRFVGYIAFSMLFALVFGLLVNTFMFN